MILSTPTVVNQLTAGGAHPGEDCAEACMGSVLADAGHPDPVAALESWEGAHGDNPADGTFAQTMADCLTANGVPAHVVRGDFLATTRALLDGHRRVIWLVRSDAQGNPVPISAIGHYLLVFGLSDNESTAYAMQPLGGTITTFAVSVIEAASLGYGVTTDAPLPTDDPEAQPMTPDEKLDDARDKVRLAYFALLHRTPESQAVLDGWASQLAAATGAAREAFWQTFSSTAEASADAAQDFARDNAAPAVVAAPAPAPTAPDPGAAPAPAGGGPGDTSGQIAVTLGGVDCVAQVVTRAGDGAPCLAVQALSGGAGQLVPLSEAAKLTALIAECPDLARIVPTGGGPGDAGIGSTDLSAGDDNSSIPTSEDVSAPATLSGGTQADDTTGPTDGSNGIAGYDAGDGLSDPSPG